MPISQMSSALRDHIVQSGFKPRTFNSKSNTLCYFLCVPFNDFDDSDGIGGLLHPSFCLLASQTDSFFFKFYQVEILKDPTSSNLLCILDYDDILPITAVRTGRFSIRFWQTVRKLIA